MSSTISLVPETIDTDTLKSIQSLKAPIQNARPVALRINLHTLDKKDVISDLVRIFDMKPESISIVEILPGSAPLQHIRQMDLIPADFGPRCTIKLENVPDSEVTWEESKKFTIGKDVKVKMSPGPGEADKARLIVIRH